MMRKTRNKIQITKDVLQSIDSEGSVYRHVLEKANLNPAVGKKYLKNMLKCRLVRYEERFEGRRKSIIYYKTKEGNNFIELYSMYEQLLKDAEKIKGKMEEILSS